MELVLKTDAEIGACIKAQANYCNEKHLSHFAPESGNCWSCRRNIYQNYGWSKDGDGWNSRRIEVRKNGEQCSYITGISGEKAASELITGCPHCNRSYCD